MDEPALPDDLPRRMLSRMRGRDSARWRWRRCWRRSRAGGVARGPTTRCAPRPPHFPARAKRVIFLFMKGGPSHVDTFDYKPRLQRDDGKPLPFAKPRVQFAETGTLLGSPWKFRQHGESGIAVSELFPHVADLRRRPLHHQLAPRHESGPRRRPAQAAHRERQLRPAQHGLVDHLRPGDREPEPAGLHHDLPDPGARRRAQLGFGVPARRLPGDAARQRRDPGEGRRRSGSSRTRVTRPVPAAPARHCWRS